MVVKYNGNDIELEDIDWEEEEAFDTERIDLDDTIELDKLGDTDE